ncbi:MAG: hypothetical protein ACLFVO_29275 [Chloroflexaceae bacterium]
MPDQQLGQFDEQVLAQGLGGARSTARIQALDGLPEQALAFRAETARLEKPGQADQTATRMQYGNITLVETPLPCLADVIQVAADFRQGRLGASPCRALLRVPTNVKK